MRCKLDPESVNLSGDQGRVDTGLQTRGGKSTRSSGSCSPEKTGRPCHEHNRAFCRAWGWPGPGGGRASVRALTAKAPGQQHLPLRWACVWGSARVSGKAPRLRARGTPEGQLGHDPFPPLGVGGLQGGAGGGGHPVLPGGAGHLQHSSPTCGPHDEPDRPLPGLPMRLRPRPLRRALLQVTRGWDQEFQVPRQPELTSAPCPPCSAARINAGSDIQGLATSARPEGHGPRSSTLRSGRSNWTARARGLPRCHSKSGAETVTCSAARTEPPMAPPVNTASGTGISPSIGSRGASRPSHMGLRRDTDAPAHSWEPRGGRQVDEPQTPRASAGGTSPGSPRDSTGGPAPAPRASTGWTSPRASVGWMNPPGPPGADEPRAPEPLRVALTLALGLRGPRAISGRSRRRDAMCQGPGRATPELANLVSVLCNQPFWPTLSRPCHQHSPLARAIGSVVPPRTTVQGGRRAGTPPPTGSALHTRVPGIWLAAQSQRLAGGRAQREKAGRACSRHLRKALMKGHSLQGASRHQHPGATGNKPKVAAGGRATGKGPPARVSRSPPLTHHRCLPRSPTEPRDKGPPAKPQGLGVLREKDSGRLQGWGGHGCPSTRTEATATPTAGPKTPPAETGRLRASWLPRGANTEEQPDTRGAHRSTVNTQPSALSWLLQNRACSRDFLPVWT